MASADATSLWKYGQSVVSDGSSMSLLASVMVELLKQGEVGHMIWLIIKKCWQTHTLYLFQWDLEQEYQEIQLLKVAGSWCTKILHFICFIDHPIPGMKEWKQNVFDFTLNEAFLYQQRVPLRDLTVAKVDIAFVPNIPDHCEKSFFFMSSLHFLSIL